jgi:molybdate transport system substrate-binding protein
MVYAAASTRDALLALQPLFERTQPAAMVFNFGSSGDLARQIIAAARADVFLSADEIEMDRVRDAGLLATDTHRVLLSNQLVVIEPAASLSLFSVPFSTAQLAQPALSRFSLADVRTVPAGRYARAWLESRGVWNALAGRVVPAIDVRAALAAVESGAVGVGIVYRTDAALSSKVRIVLAVPPEEGPYISYPVSVIAGRPPMATALARQFLDFLATDAAQRIFEDAGFLTAAHAPGQ